MQVIEQKGDYKITFNGGATYFVTDSANQCRLATPSLRKAKNKLESILKSSGFYL